MLGSTNYLERLDPGIAKRLSRFDRKDLYPLPNKAERVQYCEYWRQKLKENPELEFPKRLCAKIAEITDDLSFAYMKEAFVATLMVLVARRSRLENGHDVVVDNEDDDLDDLPPWKEIKKQIQILRDEMETEKPDLQPAQH